MMMARLKGWLADRAADPHIVTVLWRGLTGRFYVFRDRPRWFVIYFLRRTRGCEQPVIERLVVDAQRDLALRRRQRHLQEAA